MACGNCANCGDSSKGASQRSLVAYIQPCGAGPEKDALNAMVDGNYQSAIKVTGGQRQIRGSRTAKRKRTSNGSSQLCYYTESSPGENTLSLEFSSCGCGGYSPEELASEGTFDLYQLQACCGTADMGGGWSKMHVYRCISFNSLSFNDQTSFDPDDDNDLTHSFDANYVEDYYLYPLSISELMASSGVDSGVRINGMVFPGASKGCKSSCKDDCAGHWYAITNEGRVVYRKGSDSPITSALIPGYTATSGERIGMIDDKLFVFIPGGYYSTTVDSSGNPGTWVFTAVAGTTPDGVYSTDDSIVMYGVAGIWEVSKDGVVTRPMTLPVATDRINGYDECGSLTAAGASTGKVYVGSTCSSMSETQTQPTTASISDVAIQPGGNIWIGTGTGLLRYSSDNGSSWTTVSLPGSPTQITDIHWVDAGVGYITTISPNAIYSTEDGGNTWTRSGASDSRLALPSGFAFPYSVYTPCCTSKSKTMNSLFVTGIGSAAGVPNFGAIWQGTIASCA